jgi:multidrug efflux pump
MSSQKKFTDLFINRPVLAAVVSLLIFFVGLKSASQLQIREYPYMESSVITVTTLYPGASAQLIQSFITEPLQKSVATAEGIDYITSSSVDGASTITANIRLNFPTQDAFSNISAKVSEVQGQLPNAAEKPIISKSTGQGSALEYISYQSETLSPRQVTNYISQVLQPLFSTVPGVAQAQILGGYTYAMRIWLDPNKIAADGLTIADISNAIQANNYLSSAGSTQGNLMTVSITASTDLHAVDEFKNIVVKNDQGRVVHLSDVATVELGQETYQSYATNKHTVATFVAIQSTPNANPLTVIQGVNKLTTQIAKSLPEGLTQDVMYDATQFINTSIWEVIRTISEAALMVIIVIYLFLGSIRSVIIPIVTMPLSLVGAFTIMYLLGFSFNLLTLLALVLAIGMVVDDAIVVLENIHRHIEAGMSAYKSAILGAREIATPVISMTITLAAVYAPIGFMQGVTGTLFREFAFTLAGTVIMSGIIALTLSPMMCSKAFAHQTKVGGYELWLEKISHVARDGYMRALNALYPVRWLVWTLIPVVLFCCYAFFMFSQKELAPQEDQGFIFYIANAPAAANINYTTKYTEMFKQKLDANPQVDKYFSILGFNVMQGILDQSSVMGGALLKPWGDRKLSTNEVAQQINQEVSSVPGIKAFVLQPPSLPSSTGFFTIDFVIKSTGSYPELNDVANALKEKAMKSGKFMFLESSLIFDKPQILFTINREKAALLGVSIQQIGDSLQWALGGSYNSRFSLMNQSFEVIPLLKDQDRPNAESLTHLYVKSSSGKMVPLSELVTLQTNVLPNELGQFQQLNSVELQGAAMPGQSDLEALQYLASTVTPMLRPGMSIDYGGQSRTTINEGDQLIMIMFFSLLVIYLVLAAQYESFIDPIIILITVPLSIFGALLPLFFGFASLNIYSEIGLITLIGLISKHGILMVDFANNLQKTQNLSPKDAIIQAAGIRLRPILMTTAAMILGVLPLVWASEAGAASRHAIGVTVAMGMLIGTCFTLFVVPAVYSYLARDHRHSGNIESMDDLPGIAEK